MEWSFVSTTSIRLEVQGEPTPCNRGYIKKLLVLHLTKDFLSYLRNTKGSIQRPEGYVESPYREQTAVWDSRKNQSELQASKHSPSSI